MFKLANAILWNRITFMKRFAQLVIDYITSSMNVAKRLSFIFMMSMCETNHFPIFLIIVPDVPI